MLDLKMGGRDSEKYPSLGERLDFALVSSAYCGEAQ